jgi:predicted acyltransferase
MGACQWLIDIKGYRKIFQPAIVFGVNSITVYVLSGMMASLMTAIQVTPELSLKNWVVQNVFMSWMDPINASLAFALCYVLLWYSIMRVFYRRRIFLKV